ncbi:hypothetical protein Emed_006232 [Eimeria media]
MRTQTAALWLIALGSASLGSSVKLEDGNPFQEDLDREEAERGGSEEQPFAPPEEAFAKREPEERPPPRDETEGKIIVDKKVRSVLSKVKRFFAGKTLRRKAQAAEAIDKIGEAQAEKLLRCITLLSRVEAEWITDYFCLQFKDLTLQEMCFTTAKDAFKRLKAASAGCQNGRASCFLKNLRIPLTHPMIDRRLESRHEHLFEPTSLPLVDIIPSKWRVDWEGLKELFRVFNEDSPANYAIAQQTRSLLEKLYEEGKEANSTEKRDRRLWQAWQLLVRTMQIKPRADPMMTRLLSEIMSFGKCSNEKIQLPGITEPVSARHVRTRLIASRFAAALRLGECPEKPDTTNCKTIKHYVRMSNTITKYYLPLNETAAVNDETPTYKGGELEPSTESEQQALREDIEENVESHVTFILEVAEKVTTKLVDFIAGSRIARTIITAVVTNIMRFAGHLREEGQEGGAADGSTAAQSELLKSAISLDATAQVEATVRELDVFLMTARRALAQLYGQVSYKVLSRELKRLRTKSQPKRSLRQRIRRFFRFGRGQSSLQVENTSALMPVNPHGAMVENASSSTPRRMEASFVQNDKEKTFKRRHVYAFVGGTFVFLGLAVLGPVASGPLGVGLIIAGIVALLTPLIGKLVEVVTGRIRRGRSQPKLLALPAPPPREGEEDPQPPQELRESEEAHQPSQEAETLDEAGPGEESDQGRHYDIDEGTKTEALAEPGPTNNSEQPRELVDEEVD